MKQGTGGREGEGEGNDKIESWDLDDLPGIADAARRVGRIKRVNGAEGEGGREILAGSRRFTLSYTRRDYFPKISAHKRFRSPIQTLQKTIRDHPPSPLCAASFVPKRNANRRRIRKYCTF